VNRICKEPFSFEMGFVGLLCLMFSIILLRSLFLCLPCRLLTPDKLRFNWRFGPLKPLNSFGPFGPFDGFNV